MKKTVYAAPIGAVLGAMALSSTALASGWDTTGIDGMAILFSDKKFVVEGQAAYVDRNVDYKDVQGIAPGLNEASKDAIPDIWVNSVAAKANVWGNFDVFAEVHTPLIISEDPGMAWGGRYSLVKTDASALGIDGVVSYKHQLNESSNIRIFGGVRTVSLDFLMQAMSPLAPPPALNPAGLASFDLSSEERGIGWRLGAAYEMPEIALRATLIYDSATDVDLAGALSVDTLGAGPNPSDTPIAASVTLPQSVEARVQSGFAPGWMASLGVKWMDWSVLDDLTVNTAAGTPMLTRHLNYKDGWTVEAGVAHRLNDDLALGANIGWDQGIGDVYSDTYSIGLGGSYALSENVDLGFGGKAIYKTAQDGEYSSTKGGTTTTTTYSYDASWNFVASTKLTVSF
ncbi:hypothetical protein E1162_17570 [Rhodobacteraceae bacterium RKSG542]|uniref:OmpP1/FadL family transporter n=1 Tax=Pseudovibrio flavus TaxID=2529854 RepID=UPI0012BD5882|nr:outer membrane protein transport protein [Pseudovibrio flavus]MTI19055.1 hypothetical protein [Pseudovibrio flavus]